MQKSFLFLRENHYYQEAKVVHSKRIRSGLIVGYGEHKTINITEALGFRMCDYTYLHAYSLTTTNNNLRTTVPPDPSIIHLITMLALSPLNNNNKVDNQYHR